MSIRSRLEALERRTGDTGGRIVFVDVADGYERHVQVWPERRELAPGEVEGLGPDDTLIKLSGNVAFDDF